MTFFFFFLVTELTETMLCVGLNVHGNFYQPRACEELRNVMCKGVKPPPSLTQMKICCKEDDCTELTEQSHQSSV